ncbi:MAG: insulinase family protein [Rickettsiaceae bacterium H1]|nr:insulinase family protein [Rickettsiaceae bacterium H1]
MRVFSFFILFFLININNSIADVINHAKLNNGMDVYVIENHRVPIVTNMVLYRVGGLNDPRGQSGLAHFLEHLMFRGTKKIKDITSVIEQNGGRFNATTSSYYTNYFETVPKGKLELMMELEADRMRNIDISEDAVSAERKIVMEERRMRIENNLSATLEEEMLSAFYRNNMSWQVAGWLDEIKGLSKEKARFLYDKCYHPDNSVLVIAGDVTMDEVLPLVEKHYGIIPKSDQVCTTYKLNEPDHKTDIEVTLKDSKVRQQELNLWYKAPNILDEKALPLKLASIILGYGRTSYLYKELLLAGVVTDIKVNYDPFVQGEAIFEVNALSNLDLLEVKEKIVKLIDQASIKKITVSELKRAKTILKSILIYNSESPSNQAAFYGNLFMIDNKIRFIEDEVEKVSLVQVNQVMKDFLYKKNKVTGYLMMTGKKDEN